MSGFQQEIWFISNILCQKPVIADIKGENKMAFFINIENTKCHKN
jgi:hypothetical protein